MAFINGKVARPRTLAYCRKFRTSNGRGEDQVSCLSGDRKFAVCRVGVHPRARLPEGKAAPW